MIKRYKVCILAVGLFCFLGISRFLYLGYSEYISDELTALFLPTETNGNIINFLLTRRKGPLQFIVSYIPFLFTGDFKNELAERLPFAFFNTASFVFLFLFVKKITRNTYSAFFAALIAGVNGLTTALGRVVQYQSLNMFFSFASLYFFADLLENNKNHKQSSIIGTLFFMLSLLSHWDAFFVMPLIGVIVVKYFLSKNTDKFYKQEVLLSMVTTVLVFMVFLVPFLSKFLTRDSDVAYMSTRLGLNNPIDLSLDVQRFVLYNPFYVLETLGATAALGIVTDLFVKRKDRHLPGLFSFWLGFCLLVFAFLIRHAGTHIYNVIFPISILAGMFLGTVIVQLPKLLRPALVSIFLAIAVQFYYQTYMITVDHRIEYPWQQETIFGKYTYAYSQKDSVVQNNKIGFPLRRNWKEINNFINEQNKIENEQLGYFTNESKQISQFYMDVPYSTQRPFYAIGIKRPYTFVTDYKFSQLEDKYTVGKIDVGGENKVRIYKVN